MFVAERVAGELTKTCPVAGFQQVRMAPLGDVYVFAYELLVVCPAEAVTNIDDEVVVPVARQTPAPDDIMILIMFFIFY